jgi:hypothetical protein
LGFHDKSIVRYQVVRWFGLFFVFVKIIEEIIDFLLNLDRNGMIESNMVFGLDGGTAGQGGKCAKQYDLEKIVHTLKISRTSSGMQPSIENN